MGTFLHATQRVSSRNMTKIGLMILLAHLKFCWRIINFAGAVFEVKLRQQTTCASKILLALRQKIPTLESIELETESRYEDKKSGDQIIGQ